MDYQDTQDKKENVTILVILLIIFTEFFTFRLLMSFFMQLKVIIIIPLFFYCWNVIKTHRGIFSFPVKLIIFSVIFSAIPAYYCWNQPFFESFKVIPYYLGYILYFYLIQSDISIKKLEKVMIFFAWLYVILYLIQLVNYDTHMFGDWIATTGRRGMSVRIIFPGEGFLFFALAYFFHKVLKSEHRFYYLGILCVFLAIMFMQVTRQYILAVTVMIVFGLLRKTKPYVKILAVLLVIVVINVYQYSSNPLVLGLKETTEQDIELEEDYIRVLAGNYFLREMAPNTFAVIFGNGIPGHNSSYGSFCTSLMKDDGFYFVDLGLIGAYALFGILYVIGYLIIGYKVIRYSPGDSGEYLRYYMLMIFALSLTSSANLRSGYLVPLAIILYLYEKYYAQRLEKSDEDDEPDVLSESVIENNKIIYAK